MKITGWKITREQKNVVVYENDAGEKIGVYNLLGVVTVFDMWRVEALINKNLKRDFAKKEDALDFARDYMQSHPKG